jgi:coenzyme PQQ precursor peptide PqqA
MGGQVAFLRMLIHIAWRTTPMAWKTPKVIEIALGAEINSYACADLK